MSLDDDKYKKYLLNQTPNADEDDESGDSGEAGTAGGASGQIEFVDFLAPNNRENLLPNEIKQLLIIHENVNKENVKKQKDKRDTYKSLKEGKQSLDQYRHGNAQNGFNANKPPHPILSNQPQFSGVDNQVSPVVDENNANTNDDKRNELELGYKLRHQPQNAPRFNPKPTPYN